MILGGHDSVQSTGLLGQHTFLFFLVFEFLLKYHLLKEGFPEYSSPASKVTFFVWYHCFLFFSRALGLRAWNLEKTALVEILPPSVIKVWPWPRHLTSPWLGVFLCKMRIMRIPMSYELNELNELKCAKSLECCLVNFNGSINVSYYFLFIYVYCPQ